MKRKLLNGLLLASALVGVGTLQSCKDYESDLQIVDNQTNLDLQQKIDLLNNRLNDLETAQNACKAECQAKFTNILNRLDGHDRNISNLATSLTQAWIEINKLKDQRPGHTDGEIVDLIKTTLIEYGWPNENGELKFTDLLAIAQGVKDNAADIANLTSLYNQLDHQMTKIYAWKTTVDTRLAALEAQICQCQPGLTEDQVKALAKAEAEKLVDVLRTELVTTLSALQTQVTQNTETINQLLNLYGSLNSRLTQAESDAAAALAAVSGFQTTLNTFQTTINSLSDTVDQLEQKLNGGVDVDLSEIEGRLDQLESDVATLKSDVSQLKTDVSDLQSRCDDLDTKFDDLSDKYDDLSDKYDDLSGKYDDLEGVVNGHTAQISSIQSALDKLASQADLDALTTRVAANESAIQALQGDIKKLLKIYDRLNAMVTGIILEGAYNPLFGTFSLPIGVQNNMLVNYYGVYEGAKTLQFPSVGTVGDDTMLTADEASVLAGLFTPESIENGQILMNGNLGKVYLTINPSNVDLSGIDLELTKSNGEVSPVVLKNVKKSDHVLMFGGSRAGEAFYEADATLPMDSKSVDAIRVTVSDGLKSAVKDVLKNHDKNSVYTLMRGVYDQVAQGLPAYSVKHSWTVDDGQGAKNYSVFSGYDLATVTFRPLSYNTYAGQSIDRRLHKRGPLKTVKEYFNDLIDRDKFHFSLDAKINLDAKDYEVTFQLENVHFDIDPYTGKLQATSDRIAIYDKDHPGDKNYIIGYTDPITMDVSQEDLDGFVQDLMDQLEKNFNGEGGQLAEWNDQLQTQYNDALTKLINDVQGEVNDALSQLEGSINEQIDDILNDISNSLSNKTQGLVDKFNKLIDKYNKVVDKVNNFLEDPNHYLQVAMVYNAGNGDFELLSNDKKDPTYLKKGSGNAVSLFATSYTAEVAAPAYKKFVAVTAGWDAKGNAVSKTDIQALNKAGKYLATVMPGDTKRFALPAGQMKSGYTYQVLYTAVDYHGYTSTQRFYVTVK